MAFKRLNRFRQQARKYAKRFSSRLGRYGRSFGSRAKVIYQKARKRRVRRPSKKQNYMLMGMIALAAFVLFKSQIMGAISKLTSKKA